jgi:hypothetical protein
MKIPCTADNKEHLFSVLNWVKMPIEFCPYCKTYRIDDAYFSEDMWKLREQINKGNFPQWVLDRLENKEPTHLEKVLQIANALPIDEDADHRFAQYMEEHYQEPKYQDIQTPEYTMGYRYGKHPNYTSKIEDCDDEYLSDLYIQWLEHQHNSNIYHKTATFINFKSGYINGVLSIKSNDQDCPFCEGQSCECACNNSDDEIEYDLSEDTEQPFQDFLIANVIQSCIDEEDEIDEQTFNDQVDYDLSERQSKGFQAIEKLEYDWDSYGSPPIHEKVLELSKKLCGRIFGENCEIQPLNEGGIQLHWNEMEIEIHLSLEDWEWNNETNQWEKL